MKALKTVLAGSAFLAFASAAPAIDLFGIEIDHEHSFQAHHGGEIGQAARPSGYVYGEAALDRVNHRHVVYPEGEHCGHAEVIPACDHHCGKASAHTCAAPAATTEKVVTRVTEEETPALVRKVTETEVVEETPAAEVTVTKTVVKHEHPEHWVDHRVAAEHGDAVADDRDCCDDVVVNVPRGYPGLDGSGYYDVPEVQMAYAFHHLPKGEVLARWDELKAKGLISPNAELDPRFVKLASDLKARGLFSRTTTYEEEIVEKPARKSMRMSKEEK